MIRAHLLLPLLLLCSGCADECVLEDDVRRFAGDRALDCGTVRPIDDRADVDECVHRAFEADEPFVARYERMGIESRLVVAVARDSEGTVKIFQWDSAPCGGPNCDAVTDVQSCDGPSLADQTSEDPLALPVECEELGLAQRVCG